ncbi:unnamed protein product [Brachionus calyciflorus]|uniref:Reverse transcriptase RNase H-like domain-containing protein n=1 Tax=Brachionus calyciflorus TaxID=104777 RepID=A0A814MKR1_9BILA|nr:unnamed protein product [Brachionus calyciflorus]
MSFRNDHVQSTNDRIISYLIRTWTNTIDLINGVGYSVIVYSTTETIVFLSFIDTYLIALKYQWRGRLDTQKTIVQVISSTMHVNNPNRQRKRGDDGRLPQIITSLIKSPVVFRKGMDDTLNQSISEFRHNVIQLAKSLFPNMANTNDLDKIIQERFVEGLHNVRLRELAHTKMHKMRMIEIFTIIDLIKYINCKNNGFENNSNQIMPYIKNPYYTSETDTHSNQHEHKLQLALQSWLGVANYYRRFISHYAQKTKPLYDVMKLKEVPKNLRKKNGAVDRKRVPLVWTEETEKCFEELKNILCSNLGLALPHFDITMILSTDACAYGYGAVLEKIIVEINYLIAYFSKSYTQTQSKYSTSEKELLAIVMSIEYFHHYLSGKFFIVYTDHQPLTWILHKTNTHPRLERWLLRLSQYNFEIIYKPGKENIKNYV